MHHNGYFYVKQALIKFVVRVKVLFSINKVQKWFLMQYIGAVQLFSMSYPHCN
jgi:hypothetical protein